MLHLKAVCCLVFCLACISNAAAQKALYFRVGAGFFFPMEHLIHKDNHPSFRYNNHNFYPGGSIEYFYRVNDKTDILLGYQRSNIGFSYRSGNNKVSTSIGQHEFPLGVEWLIKDVWLYPIEKRPRLFGRNSTGNGYYYLALFRVKAVTGISMSIVPKGESSYQHNRGQYHFTQSVHPLHRRNFSVFGGATLQFYNRRRDKIHLILLYNQGLRKVMEMEIAETIGTETFKANLGSRGSYFATQVKIPLKLVTF
jgi:hypothetical protein